MATRKAADAGGLPQVRPDQPAWLDPELATLTQDRFSSPAWIFERKLDGERCLAFKSGNQVRLMTRNHKEDTATYPEIAGDRPPFDRGKLPRSGVHWVEPRFVGQVGFSEWTTDGQLRHPRFQGLRDDKDPADVVREMPEEPARTR